ncbi:MAG: calcium/sodium antiporter [Desulfurivibrionaceae bacterium]|nr:calcium/sodium antiporter [Desulfobulbales bacterium]MDT8334856.1 calcium/sodium antiporter [Desulfurivibrionaceae bacterium]
MHADPNFANLTLSMLALLAGLTLLVAGGESLVAGASRFALRHGMRPMVVGLTIVAFGTSTPELFVSLNAALHDHVDIMIGNVVGSNIANIGLVLAISALCRSLPVRFESIRRELFLVILVSVLVYLIAWHGVFSRILAVLFIAGLVWYTISACRGRNNIVVNDLLAGKVARNEPQIKIFALQIGGLLLLAFGSDLFIDGAVDVARHLKVSELVVGLTVAAIGTSLPELASSLSAVRRRESDILVGNIIGSNMFNLMMVMAGTAMITPFRMGGELLSRDLPVMILFAAVLAPLLYFRHRLDRLTGLALLAAYVLYVYCLV